MEQPLADVYFLVVLEHLVGDKSEGIRLETVLMKWNNVNKVCLRWNLRGGEMSIYCDD